VILTLTYQTIVIVLLLTLSFGPAFFALINTGMRHEYKTGALLASGIVASDFVVCVLNILLVNLGAANFIHDEKTQRFMGILAGIVLLVFGAFHFKKPKPDAERQETVVVAAPSYIGTFLKGFFLNVLNPTVWLLWLGNVTAISKTLNYRVVNMIVYFSITLGLVLLVELAKLSGANRLKRILTPGTMFAINVVTGTLLIIFGLVLIYNHYFDNG
jgi:threonine/homoserine/homoserine lactone efflux protein